MMESSSTENENNFPNQNNTAQAKPDKNTLHYFFARQQQVHQEAEEVPSELVTEPEDNDVELPLTVTEPPRFNLFRHAISRELSGQLHPWAASRAHAIGAQHYREACLVDVYPWNTPILGAMHSTSLSGFIQCAEFDSTGELLVTGGEDGTVLVHSGESLQEAVWRSAAGSTNQTTNTSLRTGIQFNPLDPINSSRVPPSLPKVGPLLALKSGHTKVQYLRWNPENQNVIAAASGASKLVHIFDLQQTQGRPKQTITLPQQQSSGGAGDVAFFGTNTGGYSFLAGGTSGQVFVWDLRMSGPPATTLQSTSGGGAVASVSLIEDDHLVIAGTQGGSVKAWDLRGGSGGALRFGGVLHHHPLLTAIDLRTALLEVPGLADQAGHIPSCAIHSMQLNPLAPYRAAFHLGCGWSGVLDLRLKKVTHLHAPPQPLADDQPTSDDGPHAMVMWTQIAAPTLRRKACWTSDGRRYAVPSRKKESVLLLNFEEGKYAGCDAMHEMDYDENEEVQDEDGAMEDTDAARENSASSGGEQDEGTSEAAELQRIRSKTQNNPSSAEVNLRQAAICVASMPGSDIIMAAGAHNLLSLLHYK